MPSHGPHTCPSGVHTGVPHRQEVEGPARSWGQESRLVEGGGEFFPDPVFPGGKPPGRAWNRTAVRQPERGPGFLRFQIRGLGSGGTGLGSKLIRGAVCERGRLLDALILIGAGVFLQAT